MALDKQRILNELGSVVNQLQSADCGCMGKLFSKSGQGSNPMMGYSLPTCNGCRHGCCHGHGYSQGCSAPYAGEPCSMQPACSMNHTPMGHCNPCNPPKLYADTYNYLNQNLMQPIVKEVYNDLSSLTPANAIANDGLANQMGLQGGAGMPMSSQGHMGDMNAQMANGAMGNHNTMQPVSGLANANSLPVYQTNANNQINPNAMHGMGPQIVNMMMKEGGTKPTNMPGQGGQLTGPMVIDAPQSPHGQVGVTPLTPNLNSNQAQYNEGNMVNSNIPGQNPMTRHNMPQSHTGNVMNNNLAQNSQLMNAVNPGAQQMAAGHNHSYGQHSQGIKKFNEMFPGVMQGGELGFDPMAIAIQMNPANQQKVAMDTMQKIMNGNNSGINKFMQPVVQGTNAATASLIQSQNAHLNQGPVQQNYPSQGQQNEVSNRQIANQQMIEGQQYSNIPSSAPGQFQQQQVYQTQRAAPVDQPQTPQQLTQYQEQQYQQQPTDQNQQIINPNTGAPYSQSYQGNSSGPDVEIRQPESNNQASAAPAQKLIKEPIFPVDTSRYQRPPHMRSPSPKQFDYNTLGQPVEMLPARMFQAPPVSNLPQTLSPQDTPTRLTRDPNRCSNVKSTVSKTSIMGNRRTSRSQLQHVYHQYKGSQSYTQQNLRNSGGATVSEGKLNAPKVHTNTQRQVPVERVGGDTMVNDQMNNQNAAKYEEVMGHSGDVAAFNKPHGDIMQDKPAPPLKQCRNGIQDITYPAYMACSWSFQRQIRPNYSANYRYRRL